MKNEHHFISLGLKRNGKIVKNEEYDVHEFLGKLNQAADDISFWERLSWAFAPNSAKNVPRMIVYDTVAKLVNQDGFGKKRKR